MLPARTIAPQSWMSLLTVSPNCSSVLSGTSERPSVFFHCSSVSGVGNYMTRAPTAYKGLGALASDEAAYAMGDFDADRKPLCGDSRYLLRFEPGDPPLVDAFWSVTLYDADRFLYPNAPSRYAMGDRTRGPAPRPRRRADAACFPCPARRGELQLAARAGRQFLLGHAHVLPAHRYAQLAYSAIAADHRLTPRIHSTWKPELDEPRWAECGGLNGSFAPR